MSHKAIEKYVFSWDVVTHDVWERNKFQDPNKISRRGIDIQEMKKKKSWKITSA